MNKIKWTILASAILFSICSAFATRPKPLQSGLYYWNGSEYIAAGQMGVNYVCETSSNTCTFTYSDGVYTPYQTASNYTPIELKTAPSTKPTPKQEKR